MDSIKGNSDSCILSCNLYSPNSDSNAYSHAFLDAYCNSFAFSFIFSVTVFFSFSDFPCCWR
jgi:hypothetical protein